MPIFFEWVGAVLGLLGAYLLATNSRVSRWGWVAFFLANLAMIDFAWFANANGLLLQQFGFLGSSLLGLYRAGFFREGLCKLNGLSRWIGGRL